MEDGNRTCHLLKLPRELRDIIYAYLCTTNTVLIDDYSRTIPRATALALTCKQIYQEMLEFLYIHTTFQFLSRDTALHFLMKVAPRYRRHVQRVRYITRFSERKDAAVELERFLGVLERNGVKVRDGVVWAGTRPGWRSATRWVRSVAKRGRQRDGLGVGRRHRALPI